MLRHLACAGLGALLFLATAGGRDAAAAAPPTEVEMKAAARNAVLAVEQHADGNWELAAKAGQEALAVFGPAMGWNESRIVRPVLAVTVDSLMKLGRNAEADVLLAKNAAAAEGAGAPDADPQPTPAAQQTPLDEANGLAAESFIAFAQGRYDEALAKGTAAVRAIEAIDANAGSLPQMRSLLAVLYQERLEFTKADALLRTNLEAARADGDLVQQAAWTQALARTALRQGKADAAQEGFERAQQLGVEAGDLDSQASAIGGLGDVSSFRDNSTEAIAAYRTALAMHEQRKGFGASHLITPLHNLGVALELSGQFDEAQTVLTRAVSIAERSFGASNPATWNMKHSLGRLYRSRGELDAAAVLFEGVLAEQEAMLPPTSPGIAASLNHLAETLWARGDAPARIVGLATRAAEIHERDMASVLRSGTEGQKRAYLERYGSGTDRIISYAVRDASADPGAVRLGAATVLRRKGRLLDAVSDQFALLRDRADAGTRAKLDQLASVQAQLSALAIRGPDENLGAENHAALTGALRKELEQLDAELADVVPPDERGTVQLHDVAALLGKDEVLVEFVLYRPFDVHYKSMNTAFGPEHYAAFVVQGDGSTKVVALGEAARIDEAIVSYRRALANPRSDPKRIGNQLFGWLMLKLEPALEGKTNVYLSPDGTLNLLPLAALVDAKGRYLVERYQFTYLSSGRDLLRLSKTEAPREVPLFVGSPAFSASGGASTQGTRSAGLSDLVFPPLPGTSQEIDALAKIVPSASVRREEEATESAIKQAHGPLVLHIATHGFFLADARTGAEGGRGVKYVKGKALELPSQAENPLIRSGLALAGANLRSGPDGEDGVLTALELASTDLHGTELVVLSACETGVGEVRNGDGVYGLRRALVIAGSRSQVMSLWQVDDEATRDLMTGYYKRLDKGEGRSEALRAVQRKMLKRKGTAHPFYWAAFIPSGDPGSMELEPPKPKRDKRGRGGGLDLRDYWGDKFDDPMLTVGGSYLSILGKPTLDGARAEHVRGWDVRLRGFTRPHIQLGFDFSRQAWGVPSSPRATKLTANRLEFVLGLDVLPLPYEMRVRPALVPYAGLGLAWGRSHDTPGGVGTERINERMGGAGATFGTDLLLYIRPAQRLLIGLRGGISKPLYRMRANDARLEYDDGFPRALRWQVGIDLGVTP